MEMAQAKSRNPGMASIQSRCTHSSRGALARKGLYYCGCMCERMEALLRSNWHTLLDLRCWMNQLRGRSVTVGNLFLRVSMGYRSKVGSKFPSTLCWLIPDSLF